MGLQEEEAGRGQHPQARSKHCINKNTIFYYVYVFYVWAVLTNAMKGCRRKKLVEASTPKPAPNSHRAPKPNANGAMKEMTVKDAIPAIRKAAIARPVNSRLTMSGPAVH
jgi:hypothetical protein